MSHELQYLGASYILICLPLEISNQLIMIKVRMV